MSGWLDVPEQRKAFEREGCRKNTRPELVFLGMSLRVA